MDSRRSTRIAQVALAALTLALGTATATALANDDGGATGGTTETGTTGTTTTPDATPIPGKKIRVVGTVAARDEAAMTFTLVVKDKQKWKRPEASAAHAKHAKHKRAKDKHRIRTFAVKADLIPQVGSFVLVKGRLTDDTIVASRVKVLRGCRDGERTAKSSRHHRHDGRCDTHRPRKHGDDGRRGRHGDDRRGGDDHRGRDDDRHRGGDRHGDDDRRGADARGRGRGGDD